MYLCIGMILQRFSCTKYSTKAGKVTDQKGITFKVKLFVLGYVFVIVK